MATALSNKFKFELCKKGVDMDADTFKIALMATGYVFNKDTHETWATAGVSSAEFSGAGYAKASLANSTVTEDDTNDVCITTFDTVTWTATGGSISAVGAIIYDDTHAGDIVVGYIDFGGLQTVADGGTFTITNVAVILA